MLPKLTVGAHVRRALTYKTLSFSSQKLIFVAPAKLPILIVGLSLRNRLRNVVIYCFGFLA